ncbi:hypothetical protein N7475_002122 [Penicillium sp. IBT 31633x]|nr:hypothetical protein N7475_002122 [Penicillium sp. IBT 31633x]
MTAPRGRRDQSSSPNSQFFSASQSVRRGKRPCRSDSLSPYDDPESSDSIQSDEKSIFNAIRVTTPDDTSPRFYGSLAQENPVHEQDLAVNMARFVPSGSQDDQSPTNELIRRGRPLRMAGNLEHHAKLLSDQYWQGKCRPGLPFGGTTSVPDPPRAVHRKAVSLGVNDRNTPRPRWPGNLGPAIMTAQPWYPPPKRTPTPPGVPSFGTPEAMRYSAQFLMPANGTRTTAVSARGGASDDHRGSSYGDAIRRFFCLSSASRSSGFSIRGIGRAEDGTIVQGRFPYRQSGHGTNIGRPLHEHPFHQRNLPVAHAESADITRHGNEAARAKGGLGQSPSRHVQPPVNSSSRRHSPSSGRALSFPSNPESARNFPRQPRANAIFGMSRNLSGSNVTSTSAPSASPVEPSVQGTRANGDHLPSTPSRLHSVFTMAARGSGADEPPPPVMTVCQDVFSRIKVQTCLCCSSENHEEPDNSDPLGEITSQETYATARSQISPAGSQTAEIEGNTRLHKLQAWISSVYGAMFPA